MVPRLLAAPEGGPVNHYYGTVLLMLLGPRAERENSRLDDDQHPHKETSVILSSPILRHHEKHSADCLANSMEAVAVCSASLLSNQKDPIAMRIAEQLEEPVFIHFAVDDTNLKDKLIEHKQLVMACASFERDPEVCNRAHVMASVW